MKKELSFYEFAGVIAPGSILLFILIQIYSNSSPLSIQKELTVGGLGVFAIISYALGHILQSVGNLFENAMWFVCGGKPTDWITKEGKCNYLGKEQTELLPGKIDTILGIKMKKKISEYKSREWSGITRQIYAAVKQAKAAERVDIFNGNYGLCRGLAASMAICFLALLLKTGLTHLEFLILFFVFFILSVYRMHRFARHYASELFVQFLQLKEDQ